MIELFKTAVEEVFDQTFGMKPRPCERVPSERGYTAQIPFSDGTRDYIARVWVEKPALEKMARVLLMEENPDETTLEDLTAELANFIVGHAKMVASDRDLPYEMQTPSFTGMQSIEKSEPTLLFGLDDDRCLALELKETHG